MAWRPTLCSRCAPAVLPLCSRCAPGTPGALAAAQASLSAHRSTSCSFRWCVMPFIFRGWIKIEGHIEPHVWQFWALNKHYPFFWGNRVTNLTNTHTKAYNILYIYVYPSSFWSTQFDTKSSSVYRGRFFFRKLLTIKCMAHYFLYTYAEVPLRHMLETLVSSLGFATWNHFMGNLT